MPIDAEVQKAITDGITAAMQAGEAERGKALQTAMHSAVATHLKESRPKIVEEVKAALGDVLPKADDLKTLIADAVKSHTPAPDDKGGKGGNAGPPQPTPGELALRREVEELKNANRLSAEKAANAEKKQREDSAFATMRTALASKVRPEMLDVLAKALFHADKRVEFEAETNAPLFKIRRAPMAGMTESDELLPLEAGIAEFLKSKDAEPFLPPPTGGRGGKTPAAPARPGQGASPQKYDKPATSDGEKVRRAEEREAQYAAAAPHLAR